MLYDPSVIEKYDQLIENWLKELESNPQNQAILSYIRREPCVRLRDFSEERRTNKAGLIGGKIKIKDIISPIWNREKVIVYLDFIGIIKDKLLKEPIPVDEKGNVNKKIFDAQTTYNEIRDDVGAMENALNGALHIYNKQMVINIFQRFSNDYEIQGVLERRGINAKKEETDDTLGVLESHYYHEANARYSSIAPIYERLEKHNVGKLFLLSQKDIHMLVAARMGGYRPI